MEKDRSHSIKKLFKELDINLKISLNLISLY
jgi:hypothetical protein